MLLHQFRKHTPNEAAAQKHVDKFIHCALVNGSKLAFYGLQLADNISELEFDLEALQKTKFGPIVPAQPKKRKRAAVDDEAQDDEEDRPASQVDLSLVRLPYPLRPHAAMLDLKPMKTLLYSCPPGFRDCVIKAAEQHGSGDDYGPVTFHELPSQLPMQAFNQKTLIKLLETIADPDQEPQEPNTPQVPRNAPPALLDTFPPDHQELIESLVNHPHLEDLRVGLIAFAGILGSSSTKNEVNECLKLFLANLLVSERAQLANGLI